MKRDYRVSHWWFLFRSIYFIRQWLSARNYNTHDKFDFHTVNVPFIDSNLPTRPAYGICVSHLVRYARECTQDCVHHELLVNRLMSQGYLFVMSFVEYVSPIGRHILTVSEVWCTRRLAFHVINSKLAGPRRAGTASGDHGYSARFRNLLRYTLTVYLLKMCMGSCHLRRWNLLFDVGYIVDCIYLH
jgi:hypothetical protein